MMGWLCALTLSLTSYNSYPSWTSSCFITWHSSAMCLLSVLNGQVRMPDSLRTQTYFPSSLCPPDYPKVTSRVERSDDRKYFVDVLCLITWHSNAVCLLSVLNDQVPDSLRTQTYFPSSLSPPDYPKVTSRVERSDDRKYVYVRRLGARLLTPLSPFLWPSDFWSCLTRF